ncbi:hypothetical protein [Streptomyces sp. NPDC056160]|uniref:hypothetical protein n=1 Tax=Streptomyces sp. NPDC056160 TaxID=3345731 RepID=UPI0035E20004
MVVLTGDGEQRLRAATAAQHEVEDGLFRSLGGSQRAQLTHLLMLVHDDLTDGEEHRATSSSLDRKSR